MKRTILATILITVSLGAVEVSVVGGGNYQKWDMSLQSLSNPEKMDIYAYDGFGFHAGGLVSVGFTGPDAPLLVGLQTGATYNQLYYKTDRVDSFSMLYEGNLITLPRNPEAYKFFNLTFPLLLEIAILEGSWFRWGAGIGPAVIYTPSYTLDWRNWDEVNELFFEDYTEGPEFDVGLQAKLGVGFRVWKLWIGPAFSMAYNITSDNDGATPADTRQFPSLSLETSYKF